MDRGTPTGFTNIAKARQWILEGKEGHVVAPVSKQQESPANNIIYLFLYLVLTR